MRANLSISVLLATLGLVGTTFAQDPGILLGPFQDPDAGFSVSVGTMWGLVGGSSKVVARSLISETEMTLESPSSSLDGRFGYDVATSDEVVVVGAPFEQVGAAVAAGRCYVYQKSADDLVLVAELEEPVPQAGSRFGHSVAVDGDTIAVSAIRSGQYGTDNGAVYVFALTPGASPTLLAQLGPDLSASASFFGTSISLCDDRLAVGAVFDSTIASNAGAAYVFSGSSPGAWDQRQRLDVPVVSASAFFGVGLALDHSTLAIGAEGVSNGASGSGSVFVYGLATPNTFVLEAEIGSPVPVVGGTFGQFVAAAEGRIVVADPSAGAASLFERSELGAWTEGRVLSARCSVSSEDEFASDVALNDNIVWVGASARAYRSACGELTSCTGGVFEYAADAAARIQSTRSIDLSRSNSISGSSPGFLISVASVRVTPPSGSTLGGATLQHLEWSVSPNASFEVLIRVTEPEGAWIEAETGSVASSSSVCGDGYFDGYLTRSYGSSANPLPAGTEISISVTGDGLAYSGVGCAGSQSGSISPCNTEAGPIGQTWSAFTSSDSTATINFTARTSQGESADVEIVSLTPTGQIRETYEATFVLKRIASSVYCSSPANATGRPGSLEAFGLSTSGTDLMTVRASSLPAGSLAILFQGTKPTSIPAGSLNICFAGDVNRVGGFKLATTGTADFDVSLESFMPGDSVYFQCLHRDPLITIAGTDAVTFALN